MCFYHGDADWYPSVVETTFLAVKNGEKILCQECGRKICPGETYKYVYLQQNDQAEWDPEDPEEEFDEGETDEWKCCEQCLTVLHAIKVVEAGCPPDTRQPALRELSEALFYDDDDQYIDKLFKLNPTFSPNHLKQLVRNEEWWDARFGNEEDVEL